MNCKRDRRIKQPPDEAYGRVTNSERFRPLHHAMLELLDALETRFDVDREEGYGLDNELEDAERKRVTLARPSIALKPIDTETAPITVVFTDFPGLAIRFGRWYAEWFPSCGCDACHESADGEMERVTKLVDAVTSGAFWETEIHSPPVIPFNLVEKFRSAYSSIKPRRNINKVAAPYRRGKSYTKAEFRGPFLRMSSGGSLDSNRARELETGQPPLELDWKPWPVRPENTETGEWP